MSKFKDRMIKKFGGYTQSEHRELWEEYITELKAKDDANNRNSELCGVIGNLTAQLRDARATLAGLQILKTKIETFRAEATFPKMLRSEKELKREIENKKQKVLINLFNDLISQGRSIVVDVNDKGNKYEITATMSVLEGGVINEETQLSQDAGGTGDSRESGETPQND